MGEFIKESVTIEETDLSQEMEAPVEQDATVLQSVHYLIYFLFGALDVLLVFRLILKLLGASTASGFVNFIYGLSGIFIAPFEGIFRNAVTEGIETSSVIEPANIVAIVVYAVLAWGIVKLVLLLSGKKQTE